MERKKSDQCPKCKSTNIKHEIKTQMPNIVNRIFFGQSADTFTPKMIQFHFDPYIELTPNDTYYFDVRQLESGYHYEWTYESYNPYLSGTGWMNQNPYDPYGLPFDWTFETEFYEPPPSSVRKVRSLTMGGHRILLEISATWI